MCKTCELKLVKAVVDYPHNAQLAEINGISKIINVEKNQLIQSLSKVSSTYFSTIKKLIMNLLKPYLYPQSTVPITITTNLLNKG